MAEPEYPVLRELETKLKLRWVDTDDYMATQRAIIQVEPEAAYLELPRGRKGDKGDPGPAISIQGIVASDSQLPAKAEVGYAYVNTSTKGLAVWNGRRWFKVNNFAGVDADVQQFSRWFAQIESDARRAADAAERAEFAAEETIQQVSGDFATRNYVDDAVSRLNTINIGTSHLDALRTPGRYSQPLVENATTAKGYPVAGERVNLFVIPMHETAESQVMQYLVVKNTGAIYIRDYIGGWSAWKLQGTSVASLGERHLDEVSEPGHYAQAITRLATAERGYPVANQRVVLEVSRINANVASQFLQTLTVNTTGQIYVRQCVSGYFTDWVEVGGGSFYRGVIPSSITSVMELAPGNWGVNSVNVAADLGLPGGFGTLLVSAITDGKTYMYQAQDNPPQEPGVWIASSTSSSEFSGWKKINGGGSSAPVDMSGDLVTLDTDGLDEEFVAPTQPADTVFNTADSAAVHGMYDQLMADHPEYITRRNIGTSSDGTSPIYAYTFKRGEVPGDTDGSVNAAQTRDLPLGIIFSATHGHESASVANVYAFAKMLCENWQDYPALDAIRWNCEVIIVPIVNAYGWNGRGDVNVWRRKNANEVDINRNFPRGWVRTTPGTATWSGEEPLSEPESQAVWGLLNEVKDRAVFGIDSHNFSSNENSKWRQIWEVYSHPMTMEVGKSIVQLMSRRWKERYDWIDVPESYYGYVQEGAPGTMAQGMAELGIPGSTLETNNLTFLDNSGVDYSSRAMTLGLDTIVNHIRLAFREGIRRKPGVSD